MTRAMNGYERTLHAAREANQRALEATCSVRKDDARRYAGEASMLRFKARIMG